MQNQAAAGRRGRPELHKENVSALRGPLAIGAQDTVAVDSSDKSNSSSMVRKAAVVVPRSRLLSGQRLLFPDAHLLLARCAAAPSELPHFEIAFFTVSTQPTLV